MSTAENQGQLSTEQLLKMLADRGVKVPNPAKERQKLGETGLSCRVGEKGGIAIYGLNMKFPVTLYREQFERLVQAIPQIQAFINENAAKLAVKPTLVK
jgi:hypothetical protein